MLISTTQPGSQQVDMAISMEWEKLLDTPHVITIRTESL